MQQFTKIILFLVLSSPLMLMAQPQAITAADVLRGMQQLNIDADHLLQQRKLAFTAPKLPEYPGITPSFNFQLHIAIIEILHEYELDLGLRPIPIVTASPIAYTPADVMYLNELVANMEQFSKANTGPKLCLYSAHDTTVIPLLMCLGCVCWMNGWMNEWMTV